jgi:regulator of protease activity HflC (stomatin/prohibitin superfamily)
MHDYSQLYAHAFAQRPCFHLPRLVPWESAQISEHEFALLYRRGRLVGQLPAGVHRLWGRHVQVVRLDRRRQILEVPAQELPTADGVTVKVTAQVAWQITDPVAAVTRDADFRQSLYAAVHQAVRVAVATHALAALGAQRQIIATSMREAVITAVSPIGLAVHEAVLKDVMPNAGTRKSMAAVAFAKKEALAALEKARGEQAALRALSNAARLLKDQPELAQIRGLQVLADGMRAGAHVVVNANATGLVPMARKE